MPKSLYNIHFATKAPMFFSYGRTVILGVVLCVVLWPLVLTLLSLRLAPLCIDFWLKRGITFTNVSEGGKLAAAPLLREGGHLKEGCIVMGEWHFFSGFLKGMFLSQWFVSGTPYWTWSDNILKKQNWGSELWGGETFPPNIQIWSCAAFLL